MASHHFCQLCRDWEFLQAQYQLHGSEEEVYDQQLIVGDCVRCETLMVSMVCNSLNNEARIRVLHISSYDR